MIRPHGSGRASGGEMAGVDAVHHHHPGSCAAASRAGRSRRRARRRAPAALQQQSVKPPVEAPTSRQTRPGDRLRNDRGPRPASAPPARQKARRAATSMRISRRRPYPACRPAAPPPRRARHDGAPRLPPGWRIGRAGPGVDRGARAAPVLFSVVDRRQNGIVSPGCNFPQVRKGCNPCARRFDAI